jgi:hypothetical protein
VAASGRQSSCGDADLGATFVASNPHAPILNYSVAGLRGTTAVLVTGTQMNVDAEKRLVSTTLDKPTGTG